jgi:hypothetical protein
MSARAALGVGVAGLFLGLFAFAWREASMARKAESALAATIQRQVALEAAARHCEDLISSASRRRSELEAKLKQLKEAESVRPSKEGVLKVVAVAARPWKEIALARDPKLQALYLASERAALPARYAPFLQAQGLSPDQAAALENAQLAAAERALDIKAAAEGQGLTSDDPGVRALLKQSDDELGAAQTALLGSDGYQQLQQYERTLPVRSYVDGLGGALAFTDAPLSPVQADLLVQQLADAEAAYQNGAPAVSPATAEANLNLLMAEQRLAQAPLDWDSVKPQLQTILSEPQFALLDSMMRSDQMTIQTFNMLMAETAQAPLVGFWLGRKTN